MMRRWALRVLATFALVGASMALGAAPASADVPSGSYTVQGTSWSSPRQPVSCDGAGLRVDCTPTEGDAGEASCYKGIYYSGESITVCTSHEASRAALEDAGGQLLEINYGCGLTDVVCVAVEAASRATASMVMQGLAWVVGNTSFNTSGYLWEAAMTEFSFWGGIALGVVFVMGLVSVGWAIARGSRGDVFGAFIRMFLAVPAMYAALWVTGLAVDLFDSLTEQVILRGDSGQNLYRSVENIIFGGAGGNFFQAQFVLTMLVIASGTLVLVFSFRNLALAVLVAVGPLAFMALPIRPGAEWATRYASAILALLLTTPLTLGFLAFLLRSYAGVESLWSIQALPLTMGMLLVGFLPFAVFGLFSFASGQALQAIDNVGQRGGQVAQGMTRSATSFLRDRTGASRSATAGTGGVSSLPSGGPEPTSAPATVSPKSGASTPPAGESQSPSAPTPATASVKSGSATGGAPSTVSSGGPGAPMPKSSPQPAVSSSSSGESSGRAPQPASQQVQVQVPMPRTSSTPPPAAPAPTPNGDGR